MKTLITMVALALALSTSIQAVTFTSSPFEIQEVNVLEKNLTPDILN